MKEFMNEDFLLDNEPAKVLYHKYAKDMPIFDYHCHLNPREIYEDKKFKDLTEVWLVDGHFGDHYKWRLMRAHGVSEDYITGDRSSKEKFDKWVETLQSAIGNPIYHWAHLELRAFFDYKKPLTVKTGDEVYAIGNQKLQNLSARKMIEMSNVKIIGTTDDPIDDLKWHILLKEDKSFKVKVLPSFRPDKAVNIDLDWYLGWVNDLEKASGISVQTFDGFLNALSQRIDFFHEVGCRISDHALDILAYREATLDEVSAIYEKRRNEEILSQEEVEAYKTYMMVFFGKKYHEKGWAQQYHISAMRNNNSRLFAALGPDTGFDAITDSTFAPQLAKLLNALDKDNTLPKTILYSLSPNYDQILTTIAYCFQNGVAGKIQLGSGWWFNDHIDGMVRQMRGLASCGLISKFVGMLTDSRSFMSYPRHDYFRRILCNYLGTLIENGEYPNDIETVGKIVQDICFNNAVEYFGVKPE